MANDVSMRPMGEFAKCPRCGAVANRIPRLFQNKLLVGSKRYRCGNCHAIYVRWLGVSALGIELAILRLIPNFDRDKNERSAPVQEKKDSTKNEKSSFEHSSAHVETIQSAELKQPDVEALKFDAPIVKISNLESQSIALPPVEQPIAALPVAASVTLEAPKFESPKIESPIVDSISTVPDATNPTPVDPASKAPVQPAPSTNELPLSDRAAIKPMSRPAEPIKSSFGWPNLGRIKESIRWPDLSGVKKSVRWPDFDRLKIQVNWAGMVRIKSSTVPNSGQAWRKTFVIYAAIGAGILGAIAGLYLLWFVLLPHLLSGDRSIRF